jgi:hypothetical protein
VGLSFLAVFDLCNYFLEGLVFLALAAMLWKEGKSLAAMALASGLVGIGVNFSTNISLSLLSLSQQYAVTTSEAQRADLLSAGQSLLAINSPMTGLPGTGTYLTWLLVALAGLAFACLLWPTHRATAVVGFLASGCDLAFCLTFAFSPILQIVFMSLGGLFWMLWHLLVGCILFKLSKE